MLAEAGGHGPRPIADQREIRASHQFQDVWTHHVPPRRAPYFLRAALTDGYANDAHQRENDLVEIKAWHGFGVSLSELKNDEQRQQHDHAVRRAGVGGGNVWRESW